MKKVIYTSIIGKYDELVEPKYIPKGYDFICFTDIDDIPQDTIWEIRKVIPLYGDNTRTARKYKILPHRFLPEYDISKRDQLSFNYSTWKTQTEFNWINQDIRNDGYVLEVKHNKSKR
jgi:hypothetical protein